MSRLADKAIAHERRRAGETALSDFAEYVEKQQASRPSASAGGDADLHDELDILETLNLSNTTPTVKIRELLIGDSADERVKLKELLEKLCNEGRGETLFDVGTELSLESCRFDKAEYEKAMERVRDVAREMEAGVTVLMTRGTGEESDVEEQGQIEGVSAKVLVRRRPKSMEELLEIRVAVVGNGELEN